MQSISEALNQNEKQEQAERTESLADDRLHDGNKEYQIKKWKKIFLERMKKYNPDDTRVCICCNNKKKLSEFYSGIIKTNSNHDTLRTVKTCKDCFRKKARNRYSLIMKDKHILRRSAYKKRWKYTIMKVVYGLDRDKYEGMIKKQDNKCAICGDFMKKPYIDHCHKTKKVRGMLCMYCNMGLGHFKDDINILMRAIEYLKNSHI